MFFTHHIAFKGRFSWLTWPGVALVSYCPRQPEYCESSHILRMYKPPFNLVDHKSQWNIKTVCLVTSHVINNLRLLILNACIPIKESWIQNVWHSDAIHYAELFVYCIQLVQIYNKLLVLGHKKLNLNFTFALHFVGPLGQHSVCVINSLSHLITVTMQTQLS